MIAFLAPLSWALTLFQPQPFTYTASEQPRSLGMKKLKYRKQNFYMSKMAGYLQFYRAQPDIKIHILDMRKMMVTEVKQRVQGHPDDK